MGGISSNRSPANRDGGIRGRIRDYRENSVLGRSDPRFPQALEQAVRVEGFTSPIELNLLYHLALAAPGPGAVVEIGSYLGRSTVVLATAAIDMGADPIVAVDPHQGMLGIEGEKPRDTREEFDSNMQRAGVDSHVRLFHMTSTEAADAWDGGRVRMLFVDGIHTREAVLEDVNAWKAYLAPTCCILFDDFLVSPGVRAGVQELRAAGIVGGRGLIVGKMAAYGPSDVLRSLPAPPGARSLSHLNDRLLDLAVRLLATDRPKPET